MTTARPFLASCATVLLSVAGAQTTPDEPIKYIRISGRLVDANGGPVSFGVRMSRIDADGLNDVVTARPDRDGVFTFMAARDQKYRIALLGEMKTPSITIETTTGKDIDLGNMVFEYCPAVSRSVPKPPSTSALIGDLTPEQIVIEPQHTVNPYRPVLELPPSDFRPDNALELPPCWRGPSLDRRSEWESLPTVYFDRYLSIESFVGGKVKTIRVVGYDPTLTPAQIREEVRKVWLGVFRSAASSISSDEGNRWNIRATVEYEDGKRSAILMDGWIHVQVEDREGKYWFIRLWPAVG